MNKKNEVNAVTLTAPFDTGRAGPGDILRYELRAVRRSPLLWSLLGLFTALLCWGALNTAALQEDQRQAIVTQEAADAAWYAKLSAKAEQYARPGQEQVPYWQDPTDIAGFAAYMFRAHAGKSPLPLAPLSMGQADLLPYLLPVNLDTLFGIEPAYDFETPRSLMLGAFDTGFVLTYLLPLILVILTGVLGSYERDHGFLRMIAAQGITPRRFILLRLGVLSLYVIPVVLMACMLALGLAGVAPWQALDAYVPAMLLITAYCAFWLACGTLVLSWHQGSAATVAALLGIWVMFAMAIPLGATLLSNQILAQPSRVADVDILRQASDAMEEQRDAVIAAWLQEHRERERQPVAPSYAAEQTVIVPELERRLQSRQDERRAWQQRLQGWAVIVEMVSPPTAMQVALSKIAGTDGERHQRFLEAVRGYQQELREFFYPRIQREVLEPAPPPCENCAGKLQFSAYDDIPSFRFEETGYGSIVGAVLWTAAGFLGISMVLLVIVAVRSGRWRLGDLS